MIIPALGSPGRPLRATKPLHEPPHFPFLYEFYEFYEFYESMRLLKTVEISIPTTRSLGTKGYGSKVRGVSPDTLHSLAVSVLVRLCLFLLRSNCQANQSLEESSSQFLALPRAGSTVNLFRPWRAYCPVRRPKGRCVWEGRGDRIRIQTIFFRTQR